MRRQALRPSQLWIEYGMAGAIAAALAYSAWYFATFHYLPQPFFYDYTDTWMDWFNPAYWAHSPGAYDTYKTIYPPLSYVLLKVLTFGPCYDADPFSGRECDLYGKITLHALWLINIVLTAKAMRKLDRRTWIPRTFALSFGLPMLWGLERGNLVLIAYASVLLAYGPLVRSARLRWLFAATAVNLKVYLVGAIFAQLLYRRWRWFEGALLATLAVYLLSFALYGAGSPFEIYRNIVDFAESLQVNNPLDLWMASSFQPLVSLLNAPQFPITLYVGSWNAEFWSVALPALTHVVQGTILLAAAAVWWRPHIAPRFRMIGLSIAIALMTSESGGYTSCMVILFVFMERFEGVGRRFAILAAYLLSVPADIVIDRLPPSVSDSYLGGRSIVAYNVLLAGPFVRPLILQAIALALALVTLRAAWGEVARGRRESRAMAAPSPPHRFEAA